MADPNKQIEEETQEDRCNRIGGGSKTILSKLEFILMDLVDFETCPV